MPVAEHSDSKASVNQPRVGLLVTVVLVGMIGLKFAQNYFQLSIKAQPPGVKRGDMPLQANSLSTVVADWQQLSFTPPGDVPEGQFWWSHSWQYGLNHQQAILSYDQAGWHGWHELSECYSASGWTIKSRRIMADEETGWDYVMSTFTKGELHATLIFSMFFDDGECVAPWELSLHEAVRRDMTTMDQLMERRRHASDRADARAFQCQVFAPSQTALSNEDIENAVNLHLASREQIREHWMTYRKTHSKVQGRQGSQ